jgi:hypothetical protein
MTAALKNQTVNGLSELINPANREIREKHKELWGRPNKKFQKRIDARIDDWEKMITGKGNIDSKAFHKPGSHKG